MANLSTLREPSLDSPGLVKKTATFVVGSVQYSVLDLVDFQTEMGSTDWVLMDGGDITGSALAAYIGNTLPDATGRFLRSSGGSAASMRTGQAEGTARNGLTLSWGSVNVSTSNDTHSHRIGRVTGPSTQEWMTGMSSSSGISDDISGGSGTTFQALRYEADTHGHTFNKNQMNSSQSWGGNSETRPINVTVNTFVKIN